MAENRYNVHLPDHSDRQMQNFKKLSMQQLFCDIIIGVGGSFIKAHRLILASASQYFFRVFYLEEKSKAPSSVHILQDISIQQLSWVMDYIYSGCIELNVSDIESFLVACKFLVVDTNALVFDLLEPDLFEDETVGYIGGKISDLEDENEIEMSDESMSSPGIYKDVSMVDVETPKFFKAPVPIAKPSSSAIYKDISMVNVEPSQFFKAPVLIAKPSVPVKLSSVLISKPSSSGIDNDILMINAEPSQVFKGHGLIAKPSDLVAKPPILISTPPVIFSEKPNIQLQKDLVADFPGRSKEKRRNHKRQRSVIILRKSEQLPHGKKICIDTEEEVMEQPKPKKDHRIVLKELTNVFKGPQIVSKEKEPPQIVIEKKTFQNINDEGSDSDEEENQPPVIVEFKDKIKWSIKSQEPEIPAVQENMAMNFNPVPMPMFARKRSVPVKFYEFPEQVDIVAIDARPHNHFTRTTPNFRTRLSKGGVKPHVCRKLDFDI